MKANPRPGAASGVVVSDLHLFARRSDGMDRVAEILPALRSVDVLVLNGDIFDFKWSTLRDPSTTLAAALDWLHRLVGDLPACQVHFVLGNHDCTPAFKAGMDRLAAGQPRFRWHEYTLRLGTNLFFHGDCANRRMNHPELVRYRDGWRENRQRGRVLTSAYRCVDKLGITRLVHLGQFPRQRTVERVAFYLDQAQPGWREATCDCFFGHTHLPFSNHQHAGIRYHNSGSAIRGLEFNPVAFQITPASRAAAPSGPLPS